MKMERCCDVSGKALKNLFLGVFSSIIPNGGRVYAKASSCSSFLHFPVLLFFLFLFFFPPVGGGCCFCLGFLMGHLISLTVPGFRLMRMCPCNNKRAPAWQ